jgi:hypothetical protein
VEDRVWLRAPCGRACRKRSTAARPTTECSRLIANAIIYYTLFLSRVYEQKLAAGDLEAIKILKGTSPVAWRDIHLIGNFDFTTSSMSVDIESLAARFQNKDFWRRSMTEGDDDDSPQRWNRLIYLFEALDKNGQQQPT